MHIKPLTSSKSVYRGVPVSLKPVQEPPTLRKDPLMMEWATWNKAEVMSKQEVYASQNIGIIVVAATVTDQRPHSRHKR